MPGLGHLALDRSRDLVARGELVDEPVALPVEQRRALAADGLGDEEAVGAVGRDDRGRVKLHQLEVGERRSGIVRDQQSAAGRPRRIRGPRPERGGSAGGEDRRRRQNLIALLEQDARGAPVVGQDRDRAAALEHIDAVVLGDERAQLADQPPPGRGTAGVNDPPRAVAALESEREAALTIGVEPDSERLEVFDSLDRLVAQDPRGGLAGRPATRLDRVGEV